MNLQHTNNRVSVCKKDVCINVYGDLAKAIGIALAFVAVAYGVVLLAKAFK